MYADVLIEKKKMHLYLLTYICQKSHETNKRLLYGYMMQIPESYFVGVHKLILWFI